MQDAGYKQTYPQIEISHLRLFSLDDRKSTRATIGHIPVNFVKQIRNVRIPS